MFPSAGPVAKELEPFANNRSALTARHAESRTRKLARNGKISQDRFLEHVSQSCGRFCEKGLAQRKRWSGMTIRGKVILL
jgi:hypothetical protein